MANPVDTSKQNIKRLTTEVERRIEEHFGQPGKVTMGMEIEFHAVMQGNERALFPITEEIRDTAFGPVVLTFTTEPELPNSETEKDGNYYRQLEIVTSWKRPSTREGEQDYIRTPIEHGRILEVLPRLISEKAAEYGLIKVDRNARPFWSEGNLSNAFQLNQGILLADGTNGFDDGTGHANKLMLAFIEKVLDFARDGGALLYAPTEEAISRWHRQEDGRVHALDNPTCIGLGKIRKDFAMASGLIRGRNYNTERKGQSFNPESNEGGELRYEDRLASPQAIGEIDRNHRHIDPEAPYRFVEVHLMMMEQGFKNLAEHTVAGTLDMLTEDSLRARTDLLPQSLAEAMQDFRKSDSMKELFGKHRRDTIADRIEKTREKNERPPR